ncbi:hypothetical protein LPAF129_03990 [Ligilactobacillus pabuli]|uniref:Resolvase HTH domain-containing protein n=1 Tax=Ligilactobacillus pabuli TaxID=2886039 RepID=A0ABQ5JHV4_9LACO|nr:helix-turn-helix domain-containing protein [Ligilactobacillus pabuli]GKS80714.1 hypothetical protein LPAF129_03990 [Ligilactobacillus pabuli]
MKESLKATMLLANYFEQHPDAPDDDPFVVEQRKIAGIVPNSNKPMKRRGNRKKIDDEAINRLNQQGLTRVQIADQLDYAVSTVSKHIRIMESNVPRPPHGNRKDIDEKIIKLHKQGLTRNAIAEAIGVTGTTVNKHYQKLGLTPNNVAKKELHLGRMKKLVGQGLTMQMMTEKLHVDRKQIKEAILKHGLWTHYNEIQDLRHQFVFVLPTGGYRDYDTMKELERHEDVTAGEVMTMFEYEKRKGVKF